MITENDWKNARMSAEHMIKRAEMDLLMGNEMLRFINSNIKPEKKK